MKNPPFSQLEAFARNSIDARRYPNDYHRFTLFRCKSCGVVPLVLTIEHHTGSRKGDFKGAIFARCSECGAEERVFSYTGSHREPLRKEYPRCKCGSKQFYAGECERIERDDGPFGFFDEGVVVGMCSDCGRKQAFFHTD